MSDVPDQVATIWNVVQGVLAVLIAPLGFFLKANFDRIGRLEESLAETREEMAKEYLQKSALKDEMDRLMGRFDRLEGKIDKVIERHMR